MLITKRAHDNLELVVVDGTLLLGIKEIESLLDLLHLLLIIKIGVSAPSRKLALRIGRRIVSCSSDTPSLLVCLILSETEIETLRE